MRWASKRIRTNRADLFGLLSTLLPLLLLGLIWLPEIKHSYVPRDSIAPRAVEQGRLQPSDATLDEIRRYHLLGRGWRSDEEVVAVAEKLLRGTAELPGAPPIEIHLPYDPADLERGPTGWQLQFAGLIVPEMFLEAYRRTRREEFYEMARDAVLAWSEYEGHAWRDRGFLWNDHAVAARVRVLADFWDVYRHRGDYQPEVARAIWNSAARTGAFLAQPDRFTFSTNHGVMQNLALWQLCLAFPGVPRCEEYKETGLNRLKDQMKFYIASDGVVLEHSPGYHEFGLFRLGLALRLATLLNLEVPLEWRQKYEAAKLFYAEIRRPNGSFPKVGDTEEPEYPEGVPVTWVDRSGRADPLVPATNWKPGSSFGLYPVSGYAVLWDGLQDWPVEHGLRQTFLAYSYFPGHGHKHADDMSVLLWAEGQDWWTSAGYWRYDDPDRVSAECWEGSNAPHLAGEKCKGQRATNLVSFANSGRIAAAEMERRGPGAFVVRRLVVHAGADLWVIADHASDNSGGTLQSIWTSASSVRITQDGSPGEFLLTPPSAQHTLRVSLLGPPGLKTNIFRGSRVPFVGWVMEARQPHATQALVVEQPVTGSWSFLVWRLVHSDSETCVATPSILERNGDEQWSLHIPQRVGSIEISRSGANLSVSEIRSGAPDAIRALLVTPPVGTAAEVESIHASFREAARRYPQFRQITAYRLRASFLVLAVLAAQEMFLLFYRAQGWKGLLRLRGLAACTWLGAGYWVLYVYLGA